MGPPEAASRGGTAIAWHYGQGTLQAVTNKFYRTKLFFTSHGVKEVKSFPFSRPDWPSERADA